jgi:cytochrome d ubiquinol oxidase subunit I
MLGRLKTNHDDGDAAGELRDHASDLGYALLLKRYVADPRAADAATIAKAADDTVPNIAPLFWSFRVMVGLGFYFIALFALLFWDLYA